MPWVRFDDQFPIHRKVDGLSDAAFRLHVSAIFWCARHLMDGWLPKEDLGLVSARLRSPARFAAECVIRGLWHLADEHCPSGQCPCPGRGEANAKQLLHGWFIHDYFEYQPTREKVLHDREIKAMNGRIGGIASGQTRRSTTAGSKRKAKPKQAASRSVRLPYPSNPPNPPSPNGDKGNHGCAQHQRHRSGCADCEKPPPAARHPSARTVAEAIAAATPPPEARPS